MNRRKHLVYIRHNTHTDVRSLLLREQRKETKYVKLFIAIDVTTSVKRTICKWFPSPLKFTAELIHQYCDAFKTNCKLADETSAHQMFY